MLRTVVFSAAIALTASSSLAYFNQTAPTSTGAKDPSFHLYQGGERGTTGTVIPFNVAGIASHDGFTPLPALTPGNTVVDFNVAVAMGLPDGTPLTMTSIGWDVTLTAFGESWLSELRVYFDDTVAPDNSGLFLRPGASVAAPGGPTNFASGGQLDLSDNGIPNINLPNGHLRLDFHESFDDVLGADDGIWNSGFLNIGVSQVVPTPGALALVGVAGLAGLRRRR